MLHSIHYTPIVCGTMWFKLKLSDPLFAYCLHIKLRILRMCVFLYNRAFKESAFACRLLPAVCRCLCVGRSVTTVYSVPSMSRLPLIENLSFL